MVVEDLYRPYRPKRRTRAIIAREKGLEPLANILMLQMTDKAPEKEAEAFVSEEKGVADVKAALDGAKIFWQSIFLMRQITESISVS